MGDDRAVRWLDGPDARPLVLQFADDHHAFHEDAKPGDLSLQFPIRSRSSSNQFTTTIKSLSPDVPDFRQIPWLRVFVEGEVIVGKLEN